MGTGAEQGVPLQRDKKTPGFLCPAFFAVELSGNKLPQVRRFGIC